MLSFIGGAALTYGTLNSLYRFYPYFIPSSVINKKIVPKSSSEYVMISGASDGIGKCYAYYFWQQNFNLIIIARNRIKMQ